MTIGSEPGMLVDIPQEGPLTEVQRNLVRALCGRLLEENRVLIREVSVRRQVAGQPPVNWALQEFSVRLQVLVAGLLGEDSDDQLRYEANVHASFANAVRALDAAGAERSARDTLLQGVPGVRP